MKCCFSGRKIESLESHDAYPLRPKTYYGETEKTAAALNVTSSL